jgi:hypothetical protein
MLHCRKRKQFAQSVAESESIRIQETPNSESALVASAQPPTRMTAIRQKLQQDILSVDPVKAKIQSNSSQLKSSLPRPPSAAKSIPVVSSPAIAESNEDNTPVKTTPAIPFNRVASIAIPLNLPLQVDHQLKISLLHQTHLKNKENKEENPSN